MNRLFFAVARATSGRFAALLAEQTVAVTGVFQEGAPPGAPVS